MRLIRDGEMGEGVWRWGKREIIYLSLHCHHQNDSCIKMGSDESHFNVSLILRTKSQQDCPQTTTFLKKKDSRSGIEPRPLSFKPAHKPSCRPPLVIPPDNSGKGAGLRMGLMILQSLWRLHKSVIAWLFRCTRFCRHVHSVRLSTGPHCPCHLPQNRAFQCTDPSQHPARGLRPL